MELSRYRGDLQEAEILVYKALFIAQSRKQKVRLAATLHLAEIALERGDTAGWRHAVASLEGSPSTLQNIFALPDGLFSPLLYYGLLLDKLVEECITRDFLG